MLNLSPFDTNYDDRGRRSGYWGIGAETYPGRGIAIEWVEVEGPLVDDGRRRASSASSAISRSSRSNRPGRRSPAAGLRIYAIAPGDPRSAAEKVLREFASRAFRRPVAPAEVERFVKLAHRGLDDGLTFEDALAVAFRAVITSPRFLFLDERPGPLDDGGLASRLSYFLWRTQPDDELRKCAGERDAAPALDPARPGREDAEVPQGEGVHRELRRPVARPEADRCHPARPEALPGIDDILKAAMVGETHAFFARMLRDDFEAGEHHRFRRPDAQPMHRRTLRDLRRSGEEFRRVAVPAGSHRGGLLTQASVLKVTANGTFTSPVLRGAWVLRRLLGEPPEPPPPEIPAFEPDTRGATSIRQQLARHRLTAGSASCHARIDPPGFALESFDVIGGWRDCAEKGYLAPAGVPRPSRSGNIRLGPTVDASG